MQCHFQHVAQDVNIIAYVLLTDESTFNQDGVFNYYNAHFFIHENPQSVQHNIASQQMCQ